MAEVICAEEWRPVNRFPEYEVSSEGRVRRAAPARGTVVGRIMKPRRIHNGYLYVDLYRDFHHERFLIHRLVLEAFVGPAPEGREYAAHGNGVRDDNRLSNLRWASRKENEAGKLGHGTHQFGEQNPSAKITAQTVRAIRADWRAGMRNRDLVKKYGLRSGHISRICSGQSWPAEVINGRCYFRGEVVA